MPNIYGEIEPVAEGIYRPLWSVIIPTYNCANYLKETLESVLKQYPGPEAMEIIVVDDHSTKDDPKKVVDEFGQGQVLFIKQPFNIGKSKNYETGLKASKGYYIHLLHGDDTVIEGFYFKIEGLFKQFPEAGAAFCQCNYLDAAGKIMQQTGKEIPRDGIIPNWIEKIATWQRIQPPSIVFKREVYEKIGGYNLQLQYMEDWEFYVRVAIHYKFVFTPEILANYRVFESSSSQQSIIYGNRILIIKNTIQIIDSSLPKELLDKIKTNRKGAISNYLLLFIPILIQQKKYYQLVRTFLFLLSKSKSLRYPLRGLKIILAQNV